MFLTASAHIHSVLTLKIYNMRREQLFFSPAKNNALDHALSENNGYLQSSVFTLHQ